MKNTKPQNQGMFNTNKLDEARRLVMDFHYSRRMPTNIQICATYHLPGGLFGDCGDAVAACIFCLPPTRWSEPVWELSRLVRDNDWHGPLTPLIAWAGRQAKLAGATLLVSFADWTQRHHGGIYQASSWAYHGLREPRMTGVSIDGAYVPGRTSNSLFGTRSPDELAKRMPHKLIEPVMDEGKHLYWRALNRKGRRSAQALGLQCCDYPKPDAIGS